MSKAVVHNIVTLLSFMSFKTLNCDLLSFIIPWLWPFVIHNSMKKVTISFKMSFITVNCDLLSFISHSNFMSKAERTALLKTKTWRIFITLKHQMWSMEATMRCLFSASIGIHCRGRKSSFPETAKLDQIPWVGNDQMRHNIWPTVIINLEIYGQLVTSLQVKARTDFVYKQLAGQVYGNCTIQLSNIQPNCTAFLTKIGKLRRWLNL